MKYNVWIEPEGRMLLDVCGDTPEELAADALRQLHPEPHRHSDSRIEVSHLNRRGRGRTVVYTLPVPRETRQGGGP